MKRLSWQAKQRLIRHAILSERRRLRSNNKRRDRQVRRSSTPAKGPNRPVTVNTYSNERYGTATVMGEPRPVPAVLSLSENYEATAQFLAELRHGLLESWQRHAKRPHRGIQRPRRRRSSTLQNYWDFTQIKSITPAVALIIASEYDRVRRCGGPIPRAVKFEEWEPTVRHLLDGIGFLELTGINRPGPPLLMTEDFGILRFKSGELADGSQVWQLLNELGVPDLINDPDLYDALIEAMVNTRHHAYPRDQMNAEPYVADWWFTGFVDQRNRRVTISMFDQGATIPVTLPSWERYPLFERFWKRLFTSEPDASDTSRDGDALALAMAVGRSSTGQGYRGKGLPLMEAAVDFCRSGHLSIYSRCGKYRREKGKRPEYRTRNVQIGGTLIVWDLCF